MTWNLKYAHPTQQYPSCGCYLFSKSIHKQDENKNEILHIPYLFIPFYF